MVFSSVPIFSSVGTHIEIERERERERERAIERREGNSEKREGA